MGITLAGLPVGTPVTLLITTSFDSSLTQSGTSPNNFPFTDSAVASASLSDVNPMVSLAAFSFDNFVTCLPLTSPCQYSMPSLPGLQVQTATVTASVGDQLQLAMQDAVGINFEQEGVCPLTPPPMPPPCGVPGSTTIQANGLNSFDLNIDVLTPGAFLVSESGASYASTSATMPEPPTFGLLLAGFVATYITGRHARRKTVL